MKIKNILFIKVWSLLLLVFFSTNSIKAETLYGVSGTNLYTVNSNTGIATVFGTTISTTTSLAKDPEQNRIYYYYGSPIRVAYYDLDTNTNTLLPTIGPALGTIYRAAFDHLGNLYLLRNNPRELYSVNKTTGQLTLLGTITVGVLPGTGTGDIAFPPNDNTYFYVGATTGLFRVNRTTLVSNHLGNLTISGNLDGLGFDSQGNLFASTSTKRFYLVNINLVSAGTAITNNMGPTLTNLTGNLSNPNLDTDSDGLTDLQEGSLGTNPLVADTDSDGLNDGDEVNVYLTNPLIADTDNDGLSDGDEINIHLTDPLDIDTDNDGLNDGFEILNATDPLDPLSPLPLDLDTDADGLTDLEEISLETDTCEVDTDNDGINDGDEVHIYGTDPLDTDSDDDGISDYEEVFAGLDGHITDPLNPDTDGDGIIDGVETSATGVSGGVSGCSLIPYAGTAISFIPDLDPTTQTDPINADTDGSGLPDGVEDANKNGIQEFGESDPNLISDDCENSLSLGTCDCKDLRGDTSLMQTRVNKIITEKYTKAYKLRNKFAISLGCSKISKNKALNLQAKLLNLKVIFDNDSNIKLPDFSYNSCGVEVTCDNNFDLSKKSETRAIANLIRRRTLNYALGNCPRKGNKDIENIINIIDRIDRKVARGIRKMPLSSEACIR